MCFVDLHIPFQSAKGVKELNVGLRSIHDIDEKFTKDASRYNLSSGTTAAVVLLADAQILVANLGDSKAFLCSEVYQSPAEAKATAYRIIRQRRAEGIPLSVNERNQLKQMASNGWKVLSRAIGDIHFKNYGVILIPEVTDWQPLTANDSYVIAASDGVFEKLSP